MNLKLNQKETDETENRAKNTKHAEILLEIDKTMPGKFLMNVPEFVS